MGIGMSVTSLSNTLVIHTIAAPIIFSSLSLLYFKKILLYCPFANGDNHGFCLDYRLTSYDLIRSLIALSNSFR